MKKITLLIAITILFAGCVADYLPVTETNDAPPVDDANYVLTNGKIYTVNEKQPWAEAMAVQGNKIVFVGSSKDVKSFVGKNTRVADLKGRLVLPGMIDSHLHAILGTAANSGVWVADIPDIDGVLLAQGSDFPADPRINPFIHMEGSVTRHYYALPLSSKIKNPTNRISVKEAVESYTINGAKLLRMEDNIGSLEVGKLADLIIVDQNIMEIDPNQIHETRVLMTMMDGKVWHDLVFGWGDAKDDVVPDAAERLICYH